MKKSYEELENLVEFYKNHYDNNILINIERREKESAPAIIYYPKNIKRLSKYEFDALIGDFETIISTLKKEKDNGLY